MSHCPTNSGEPPHPTAGAWSLSSLCMARCPCSWDSEKMITSHQLWHWPKNRDSEAVLYRIPFIKAEKGGNSYWASRSGPNTLLLASLSEEFCRLYSEHKFQQKSLESLNFYSGNQLLLHLNAEKTAFSTKVYSKAKIPNSARTVAQILALP